jgi:two-component system, chemotaxis family, sensor kinase CheA
MGKPAEGRLILKAATEGDLVVMEVADDGAGMNLEKIASQARKQGLLAEGEEIDEKNLPDILCAPGFSSRTEADLTSGRGVGLTVVRDAILDLGGTLELQTAWEKGTCFIIRLPLTLAIADALIVTVGDQTFAVPQALIREVIEIDPAAVKVMENNEIIFYRGSVLPLIRLARRFNLEEKARQSLYGLVVGMGINRAAIVVDRIMGRREIVVRAISDPLLQVPGISGATELGDGRAVLILDTSRFLQGQRQGIRN